MPWPVPARPLPGTRALAAVVVPVAVLAVSALASAITIYREYRTREVENRLEDQMTLIVSDDSRRPRVPPETPTLPTARLLVADALYLAREASRHADGPLRRRLLARADREIAEAASARPHWAEAWVTAAYIASLRSPPQAEPERLALIRSYADAPVLAKAGYWRVERSFVHWPELPAAIRSRAIEEAAWLLRYGEIANRAPLFDLVRRSPAYRPIFLRWRTIAKDGGED